MAKKHRQHDEEAWRNAKKVCRLSARQVEAGRYSIRINDQYRVTFRWEQGHAHEVRVEDYH